MQRVEIVMTSTEATAVERCQQRPSERGQQREQKEGNVRPEYNSF